MPPMKANANEQVAATALEGEPQSVDASSNDIPIASRPCGFSGKAPSRQDSKWNPTTGLAPIGADHLALSIVRRSNPGEKRVHPSGAYAGGYYES